MKNIKGIFIFTGLSIFLFTSGFTQKPEKPFSLKDNYTKAELYVTMRDGVNLFTVLYTPKDTSEIYPIIMERTPYSCAPYGVGKFPTGLGPNKLLDQEKYIFVVQDVRGRYKSEGNFEEMTPGVFNKKDKKLVDESSDTFDTIEWLLKNTRNNGKVGLFGISYPGFYASASLPNAHPAIKAVSPQAPVTDEFIGDDCYHNGAFFLLDNFDFYNYFDGKKDANGENYAPVFKSRTNDAYSFFLKMGPLKNSNGSKFFT
ncbi:MAG: CocE/NonD family hydrolase, partial [Chitinophagaceae bacterium]